MGKDTIYFSHDSNARHDPKISALINKHHMEGYGRFWVIVEMLREQEGYRLPLKPYVFDALAMQMQCDASCAQNFVLECIKTFELFQTDESGFFWSDSLLRRMEEKEARSAQAKRAAESRWGKSGGNAGAMQEQCGSNAINQSINQVNNNMPQNGDQKKARKSGSDYTPEFEQAWEAYPRKKEKQAAFESWRARVREGESMENLFAATKGYASECVAKGTDQEFIKQGKTFYGPKRPYKDYIQSGKQPTTLVPGKEIIR